jgi:hypothetical protein
MRQVEINYTVEHARQLSPKAVGEILKQADEHAAECPASLRIAPIGFALLNADQQFPVLLGVFLPADGDPDGITTFWSQNLNEDGTAH